MRPGDAPQTTHTDVCTNVTREVAFDGRHYIHNDDDVWQISTSIGGYDVQEMPHPFQNRPISGTKGRRIQSMHTKDLSVYIF